MAAIHNGVKVHINGIVQGVGFRPFVYNLAQRMKINGWVRNTAAGVDIEAFGSGEEEKLKAFIQALETEAPPLAQIDDFLVEWGNVEEYTTFTIIHSEDLPGSFQPISPDVGICHDCLEELFEPTDQRYRYPFINCTNCGPRFTIIRDIPYDRPYTTMAGFSLCEMCAKEYEDPSNRRFHAQPVACSKCGPRVWLEHDNGSGDAFSNPDVISETRTQLRMGQIIAVKGLGGFHIACDASNTKAVEKLRLRKMRVDKPFAIMVWDLETAKSLCEVNEAEAELLTSYQRPIVVLKRRTGTEISKIVAPGQDTLGVMLPYTPLHYLLLEPTDDFPRALVMTSGNLTEEPLAIDNTEARARLSPLVDAFLFNDRDIHIHCDDSVVRILPKQKTPYFLRRSRGYTPRPLRWEWDSPPMLALGAELKNTFCLAKGRYAFPSQHIGDLKNYETLLAFERGIIHFEKLFRIKPEILVHDLHPNYLSSRYAHERAEREELLLVGVQHHHAHIVSCMVEHNIPSGESVIGVSFDGTGYGTDGAIWGGEFLVCDYRGFERPSYLFPMPLPGGDKAIKEPWRMALVLLHQAGIDWDESFAPVAFAPEESKAVLAQQIASGLNTPLTSSMGRLFDGVAALAGVRQIVNYEAQAAIEFEMMVDPTESEAYPFGDTGEQISAVPMIEALVSDLTAGVSKTIIAARFHRGVAKMVADNCKRISVDTGLKKILLSGGVWQNMVLLEYVFDLLEIYGLEPLVHTNFPTNDGGVALGQAVIAYHNL